MGCLDNNNEALWITLLLSMCGNNSCRCNTSCNKCLPFGFFRNSCRRGCGIGCGIGCGSRRRGCGFGCGGCRYCGGIGCGSCRRGCGGFGGGCC